MKLSDKSKVFLICITLAIATCIAYEPVRHNDFITHFDDDLYIIDNNHVTSGLTIENIIWALKAIHAHNWHPLTWISHMLDCELFGLNPTGHHFTNLLLHITNAILLFLLLRRMTGKLWHCAFVAAIFALHPLHVESVAWASERKDVLSTFFWILTIWAYIRYVENPKTKRYLLMFVLFALGLTAKQMLVTLPFLLLLLDYWPLKRIKFNEQEELDRRFRTTFAASTYQCALEKIPLFILSAYASRIIYVVQQHTGVMQPETIYPLFYRFGNALISYLKYIGKMLWPQNLAIFYPHPLENLHTWQIVGAALCLTFVTAFTIWKMKTHPYLVVGWLWYLGTLVPVIGLVQVGVQAYADRYTYMPHTGLFIITTWGVSEILARIPHRKIIFSLCVLTLLSVLIAITRNQVKVWRDEQTLYRHATVAVKDNWWAYNTLGSSLKDEGKLYEAIENYNKAINISPDHAVAYYNLGHAFYSLNELEEAIRCWSKTLEINPNYRHAHENLAIAFYRLGNTKKAIEYWSEAIKRNPNNQKARDNLKAATIQLFKENQRPE